MKPILDESTDVPVSILPISEIENLVRAKDIISLVSRPYFAAAIKSLYPRDEPYGRSECDTAGDGDGLLSGKPV